MNRVIINAIAATAVMSLAACGNGTIDETRSEPEVNLGTSAPEVTFEPAPGESGNAKPGGPVAISYRIIGQPIVGRPVAVDLQFSSALRPQAITVSYRINDETALQFPEAQPARVSLAASADDTFNGQQVTVVPLREGRLFLNVSATVETENGSMSSVTAIPIQVGTAIREPAPMGELGVDETGEAIIKLPAKED